MTWHTSYILTMGNLYLSHSRNRSHRRNTGFKVRVSFFRNTIRMSQWQNFHKISFWQLSRPRALAKRLSLLPFCFNPLTNCINHDPLWNSPHTPKIHSLHCIWQYTKLRQFILLFGEAILLGTHISYLQYPIGQVIHQPLSPQPSPIKWGHHQNVNQLIKHNINWVLFCFIYHWNYLRHKNILFLLFPIFSPIFQKRDVQRNHTKDI